MKIWIPLLLSLGCSKPSPSPSAEPTAMTPETPQVTEVDVFALAAALEAGTVPVLVDVRTPAEYANGHVPLAINIPVDELPGRMDELSAYRDVSLYVICQSGGRSSRAANQLLDAGFKAPINVDGGTGAWVQAGKAVE